MWHSEWEFHTNSTNTEESPHTDERRPSGSISKPGAAVPTTASNSTCSVTEVSQCSRGGIFDITRHRISRVTLLARLFINIGELLAQPCFISLYMFILYHSHYYFRYQLQLLSMAPPIFEWNQELIWRRLSHCDHLLVPLQMNRAVVPMALVNQILRQNARQCLICINHLV